MKNILFLGCGKMGSILLHNLIEESGFESSQIVVLEKSEKNKIDGISYFTNAEELPKNYRADLVFLAIKPQDAKEILEDFSKAKIFHKNTIFISILAGKNLAFFEKFFGKKSKIVRSMPNLPIQYSQGILAYLCNKNINKLEKKSLHEIFSEFGLAYQLKNEKDFEVITAIAGSGPAYIFLLQEIFAEIASSFGVNKEMSAALVKKLFLGSAFMSEFSEESFAALRESVTSKKGTTEAALKVFQKNQALKKLCQKAVIEAVKRSKELSKNV